MFADRRTVQPSQTAELYFYKPFVHAHVLRLLSCWLQTLSDNTLNRGTHQLHVVAVSAVNCQSDRDIPCPSVSKLCLTSALPRSVGLGPIFSHPMALWSLRRPCSSHSSRSLSTRQTAQLQLARTSGTGPLLPIPETDPALSSQDRCRYRPALRSIVPTGRHGTHDPPHRGG